MPPISGEFAPTGLEAADAMPGIEIVDDCLIAPINCGYPSATCSWSR
jgi:hypothetical protein